ncbi:hypothetical protein [Methylopila sp. 73B]|uniref:hypothetical protein n=1 Tax=Methylopila sp. 73B TaxID=1120792 RepID=UPI000372AF96|nr:hypothetical protein [Methylopila sp. 73B]
MPRPNEDLAEALRIRLLALLRHQVTVHTEIERYLTALDKAIAAQIIEFAPTSVTHEVYRQERLAKLLAAVAAQVSASYRDIRRYHVNEMADLAQVEALYLTRQVNEVVGRDLLAFALPAAEAVGLVRSTLVSGAPMADWWEGQSVAARDAFNQMMRIGVLGGESDADLIKRVRGTREMAFKDGLVEVSRRRAKLLVRGASSAITGAVRKKAVEDNPRVFRGIQQISVLDGRTSHTCISYAGKVWTVPDYKPVGHKLPYNGGTPRHPGCRSTEIAVLQEKWGGAPADDMDFDTFLSGKSPEFTDQLLGKGRAELYRAGKITLADLVDQRGRPLTLEQLKASH